MNLVSLRDNAKPVLITTARTAAEVARTSPRASGRGIVRLAQSYRCWVLCERRVRSAEQAGKLYAEADRIRDHQHARMKGSLIGLAILVAGIVAFWYFTPGWVQATAIVATWTYLVRKGWARAELLTPRRKPGLLGITKEQLTNAFLAAGVIKKDQHIGVVQVPHTDGPGVGMTLEMPPGITAASAISSRDRLASALTLNTNGLMLSPASGDTGHAGQLQLWGAPGDPFAAGSGPHPLLGEQRANAWRGAAFGRDARGREIRLRLVGTNMLIGAAPNAGKTFAGRCAAAPFILDPGALLLLANGKGDDAWAAAEQTAAHYTRGYDDAAAARVSAMLDRVIAEMDSRNARRTGSKLTETRSRDAADPMPLLLVLIDELQNFTGNSSPDPDSTERKPPTIGQTISRKLTHLAKNARSSGIILLLLTQRPDDDSLPKGLRAVLMTRFALRTRDRWNSDMILGPDFSARGYCTAQDDWRKGVGILVPDDDDNEAALASYPTLRTYEIDDDEWQALCRRGAALRADQDPGDGFGGGEAGPEPEPVPSDDVSGSELPANIIWLREVLSRDGNTFRASAELQQALGMNSRDFNTMMRSLGVRSERGMVKGENGPTRLWGYWPGKVHRAISDLDAEMDGPGDAA